jgi:adenylate cyclase
MSLLRELQRRNVIRVATAYVVTAWLIIQVIETIFPAFGFGDEAIRLAVIVLGIGFIPAVIGAWVFEWTPEGLKRDQGEEAAPGQGRNFDRAIVVILALGIVYFAFDKFVLAPERAAEREAEVAEQAAEEARKGFYGDRSIAVLPFDNLSSDPEQVYFVDGVAEEILNLLARIRDLRVISRSSSFSFRDQERNIPDIADKLDVAHILEGSVRRAGNRVRVTAQLIDARTDTHLWSKTYERELDDVFRIQDEIAADVAKNLELTLRGPLPHSRNVNPDVLALVQQAKQIFEIRGENTGLRMKALLEKALELDPEYAPAIEWLSYAEFVQYTEGTMPEQEMRERWLGFRAQLLQLDPDSAIVAFNDAWSFWEIGDLEQAAEKFLSVLATDLSNSLYVRLAGMFARDLGRLDVAQRLLEHSVAIDPFCYQCLRTLSQIQMNRGDVESALTVRERYMAIASGGSPDYSMMLMQAGRPEEVAAAWAGAPDSLFDKRVHLAMAEFSMGNGESARAAVRQLDDELATASRVYWTYMVASAHAWLGNRDRAFELLMSLPNDPQSVLSMVRRYHPVWGGLRDDPRWLGYLEYIGRSPERLDAIEFDPWLPE